MNYFYIVVAFVSTFIFCILKKIADIKPIDDEMPGFYYVIPMAYGFFWPLGWAIYAPYLVASCFMRFLKEYKRRVDSGETNCTRGN